MRAWYLDASAIVKLAAEERETRALAAWRAGLPPDDVLFTCEIALTEVLLAIGRVDGDLDVALAHLDSLEHLVVDRDLLLTAARLGPLAMRTLDAIHLAAAAAADDDLAGLVTYDDRMTDAARDLGLAALAPGS